MLNTNLILKDRILSLFAPLSSPSSPPTPGFPSSTLPGREVVTLGEFPRWDLSLTRPRVSAFVLRGGGTAVVRFIQIRERSSTGLGAAVDTMRILDPRDKSARIGSSVDRSSLFFVTDSSRSLDVEDTSSSVWLPTLDSDITVEMEALKFRFLMLEGFMISSRASY